MEPAPFDYLVIYAAMLVTARKDAIAVRSVWPLAAILPAFLLSSLLPVMTEVVIDTETLLRYTLITAYLLILFYVVVGLISTYGRCAVTPILDGCASAGVFSSIFAIISFSGAVEVPAFMLYGDRPRAFFKDPNVLGPFLGFASVWLAYRYGMSRTFTSRCISLSGLFVCIFGVVISFSRGAWAGTLISLLVYLSVDIYRRRGAGLVSTGIAFLSAASVMYGVIFFGMLNPSAMESLFHLRLQKQRYDEERFHVQELALAEAVANPLGIGGGQSEIYFPGVVPVDTGATHNTYLRIAVENGWIGAFSFGAFLCSTLYLAARMSLGASPLAPIAAVALAAIIGILFQSLFIDTNHWRHFWILCGLVWGLHAHRSRTRAHREGTLSLGRDGGAPKAVGKKSPG